MAPLPPLADLGFPAWLRAAHWINVFFIGLLLRSGIQILSSYPRLYWGKHSTPGHEWLKLTRKAIPTDRHWITLEQETNAPASRCLSARFWTVSIICTHSSRSADCTRSPSCSLNAAVSLASWSRNVRNAEDSLPPGKIDSKSHVCALPSVN